MKTENKQNYKSVLYLAVGELIVSLLIVLVYIALGQFNLTVITGALLGSAVTVFNFILLSVQVNKAIDEYITLRGDRDMTEEEAAEFSKRHGIKVQNAVTKSYVLRTGLMIGSLVVAFITKWFSPIATLIPLLLYKPLLYVVELINTKRGE